MRAHGLACDNLRAVELVTASGEVKRVAHDEHPELFWAIRGGGGNFGIVTRFEYRLHPLPHLFSGIVLHRPDRARELLGFYREYTAAAPDCITTVLMHLGAITSQAVPPELRHQRMYAVVFAADVPHGTLSYQKACYQDALTDAAIEVIVSQCAAMPTTASRLYIHQLGGAVTHVDEDDSAVSHRTAGCGLSFAGTWDTRPRQTRCGAGCVAAVVAAYGDAKYRRLAAIKARHDPANVFQLNQHILPAMKDGVPRSTAV